MFKTGFSSPYLIFMFFCVFFFRKSTCGIREGLELDDELHGRISVGSDNSREFPFSIGHCTCNRWVEEVFYGPFSSISVISSTWESDNGRLYSMESSVWLKEFSLKWS